MCKFARGTPGPQRPGPHLHFTETWLHPHPYPHPHPHPRPRPRANAHAARQCPQSLSCPCPCLCPCPLWLCGRWTQPGHCSPRPQPMPSAQGTTVCLPPPPTASTFSQLLTPVTQVCGEGCRLRLPKPETSDAQARQGHDPVHWFVPHVAAPTVLRGEPPQNPKVDPCTGEPFGRSLPRTTPQTVRFETR